MAGFIVWFFLIRGDPGRPAKPPSSGVDLRPGVGPVDVTRADLSEVSRSIDASVYWAGEPNQATLEMIRATDDRVSLRYLDRGIPIGSDDAAFLTVTTYPLKHAFDLLENAAREPGAVVDEAPGGGIIVTSEDASSSVYMAFPGEALQVEIYDPDPGRALRLASLGRVEPVGQ